MLKKSLKATLTLIVLTFIFAQGIRAEEGATIPIITVEPGKTLYERLGGEAAIQAVVGDFVGRAAADPAVNFTRQGTGKEWNASEENIAGLKKHLTEFLCLSTGGVQLYEGKDMKTTHEGMKITSGEFDALAADLKASLDKFNVPAREQQELLGIAGSTRSMIVEEEVKPEASRNGS